MRTTSLIKKVKDEGEEKWRLNVTLKKLKKESSNNSKKAYTLCLLGIFFVHTPGVDGGAKLFSHVPFFATP